MNNNISNLNSARKELFLKTLLADLEKYEKEHSPSTIAANRICGILFSILNEDMEWNWELDTEGKFIKTSQKDVELQRKSIKMRFSEILHKYQVQMREIGLTLYSDHHNAIMWAVQEVPHGTLQSEKIEFEKERERLMKIEDVNCMDLKIDIVDSKKFLKFISSLPDEILPETKQVLQIIASKLVFQMEKVYDYSNVDDSFLDFVSYIKDIVRCYDLLGVEVKVLKEYSEKIGCGYFQEYLLVKKNGYFSPIGEWYFLSTFHLDTTGEVYQKNWEQYFFDVIRKVSENPRAKMLYNQVIRYARESILFSEKDFANRDSQGDRRIEIQNAIQNTKKRVMSLLEIS